MPNDLRTILWLKTEIKPRMKLNYCAVFNLFTRANSIITSRRWRSIIFVLIFALDLLFKLHQIPRKMTEIVTTKRHIFMGEHNGSPDSQAWFNGKDRWGKGKEKGKKREGREKRGRKSKRRKSKDGGLSEIIYHPHWRYDNLAAPSVHTFVINAKKTRHIINPQHCW